MKQLFADPLHEQLGTWPLAYIPYGGADYGEIVRIAEEVGEGDDSAFHAAWTNAAERLAGEAAEALARGHHAGARELYLRAACFHAKAFQPLFGEPVDPRLVSSFRQQMEAFDAALALGDEPSAPLRIPFEQTTLPAYLIGAAGRASEVRPLIIFTNGYDGAMTDMYFASAVAASRRGYHALIFEGPGQGEMLIEHGLRMRPDWETVVGAVVDYVLTLPNVDAKRIALNGWSLGGYLAPRAASGEHRLAACIADPGQSDITVGLRALAVKFGATPEAAAHLGELDAGVVDRMGQFFMADRKLRWTMVQRAPWVHGAPSLREYLQLIEAFTMAGRAERIRCPTLVTLAEDDPIARSAQALFDDLRCQRTLVRFTAEQGASSHCEMGNRSRLNRVTLDWLDEVMAGSA
ncbi:MAG: alpha/beta hydrolase family protein [Rhizobacter sp.]